MAVGGRRGGRHVATAGGLSTGAVWRRLNDPTDTAAATAVAVLLMLAETVLTALIVYKVPYTEIDWVAYMEQVELIEQGERDYMAIKGGTGPLVYPAGHVLLYRGLYRLTGGGHIPAGQVAFAVLYLATQALVLYLYVRSCVVPPWALPLLCLSKRMHSIYVLRLFNDCIAMMFAYVGAALLLQPHEWAAAAAVVAFSAGVSVKMNVLLWAPPVLAVLLQSATPRSVLAGVGAGVALQAVLAAPFLLAHPASYAARAFEFSRVFMHRWTVNLKFLPEPVFLSKGVAVGLLASHVALLALFAGTKWFPRRARGEAGSDAVYGGDGVAEGAARLGGAQAGRAHGSGGGGGVGGAWAGFWGRTAPARLPPRFVLYVLCTGNFVGVACSRTLHYQFYSWYFHTLPLLLWAAALPDAARLVLWGAVEVVWNVYPSRAWLSVLLQACHVVLLTALLAAPPQWSPPPRAKRE